MNAYIMAAGLAMRLRPKTDYYPKCLLIVDGMPILQHWLDRLEKTNHFENIYVNVHHCADMVESWLENYSLLKRVKNIKVIDERSKLLGTAGTLFYHGDTSDDFLCVYSDTFSHGFFKNLASITSAWKENPDNALAGLISFNRPDDGSASSIEVDFMGTIKSFSEKTGKSLLSWAGIMYGRKDFFNEIKKDDKDLAKDVFPRLCGRIRVMSHVDAYDIGRGIEEYDKFNSKLYSPR